MKLPKGLVFLMSADRLTINISERELVTCEDCKYAVSLNGEKRLCTQHEHAVSPHEWCSRAEKSKYSKTKSFELGEYTLTTETDLSNIMRESMYALAGYYEE